MSIHKVLGGLAGLLAIFAAFGLGGAFVLPVAVILLGIAFLLLPGN